MTVSEHIVLLQFMKTDSGGLGVDECTLGGGGVSGHGTLRWVLLGLTSQNVWEMMELGNLGGQW